MQRERINHFTLQNYYNFPNFRNYFLCFTTYFRNTLLYFTDFKLFQLIICYFVTFRNETLKEQSIIPKLFRQRIRVDGSRGWASG